MYDAQPATKRLHIESARATLYQAQARYNLLTRSYPPTAQEMLAEEADRAALACQALINLGVAGDWLEARDRWIENREYHIAQDSIETAKARGAR